MRNRKRFIIYSCLVVLILVLTTTIGCLPAPTSTTKTVVTTTDTAQNTRLDDLTNQIAALSGKIGTGGVSKTEFDGLVARVATVEGKSTVSKSDYDALVAQVNTLKTDVEKLKTGTSGTGGTGGTGTTTGGVSVSIYSTSPSTIYDTADYNIFLEVKNTNASSKKVYLTGTITSTDKNAEINTNVTTGTRFSNESSAFTGNPSASFIPAPASDISANCETIIAITPSFFVGGNQTIMIPIKLHLVYDLASTNKTFWTPTWAVTVVQ
jgi:hypothetical protein